MNAGIRSKISSKELKLSEYMKIAEILNKFAKTMPFIKNMDSLHIRHFFQMQTGDSSYSSKDQLTKRAIYNIIKTFGSKVILTLIWQCLEEFQFYPIDAESYHT